MHVHVKCATKDDGSDSSYLVYGNIFGAKSTIPCDIRQAPVHCRLPKPSFTRGHDPWPNIFAHSIQSEMLAYGCHEGPSLMKCAVVTETCCIYPLFSLQSFASFLIDV